MRGVLFGCTPTSSVHIMKLHIIRSGIIRHTGIPGRRKCALQLLLPIMNMVHICKNACDIVHEYISAIACCSYMFMYQSNAHISYIWKKRNWDVENIIIIIVFKRQLNRNENIYYSFTFNLFHFLIVYVHLFMCCTNMSTYSHSAKCLNVD